MAVGFGLALRLKPDPREIAQALPGEGSPNDAGSEETGSVPLRVAIVAPGSRPRCSPCSPAGRGW